MTEKPTQPPTPELNRTFDGQYATAAEVAAYLAQEGLQPEVDE